MLTYALMGLLVVGLTITTLWGVKYQPEKDSFDSYKSRVEFWGFYSDFLSYDYPIWIYS